MGLMDLLIVAAAIWFLSRKPGSTFRVVVCVVSTLVMTMSFFSYIQFSGFFAFLLSLASPFLSGYIASLLAKTTNGNGGKTRKEQKKEAEELRRRQASAAYWKLSDPEVSALIDEVVTMLNLICKAGTAIYCAPGNDWRGSLILISDIRSGTKHNFGYFIEIPWSTDLRRYARPKSKDLRESYDALEELLFLYGTTAKYDTLNESTTFYTKKQVAVPKGINDPIDLLSEQIRLRCPGIDVFEKTASLIYVKEYHNR